MSDRTLRKGDCSRPMASDSLSVLSKTGSPVLLEKSVNTMTSFSVRAGCGRDECRTPAIAIANATATERTFASLRYRGDPDFDPLSGAGAASGCIDCCVD